MPNVRRWVLAALALVSTGLVAVAVIAPPAASGAVELSARDRAYLVANAQTDLAEIAMAKIATSRSQDSAVLALAARITRDHTQALSELKGVARPLAVTLPTEPSPKQNKQAAQLKVVPAKDFDVTYLQVQVNDHTTSVRRTRAEIKSGRNTSVVDFARTYLKVASAHLAMARSDLHTVSATRVADAPASNSETPPKYIVTKGPEAYGAKSEHSNDAGWLIGAAVVIALLIGGGLMRLRHSLGSNDRRR